MSRSAWLPAQGDHNCSMPPREAVFASDFALRQQWAPVATKCTPPVSTPPRLFRLWDEESCSGGFGDVMLNMVHHLMRAADRKQPGLPVNIPASALRLHHKLFLPFVGCEAMGGAANGRVKEAGAVGGQGSAREVLQWAAVAAKVRPCWGRRADPDP